jgi:hypothetical protein
MEKAGWAGKGWGYFQKSVVTIGETGGFGEDGWMGWKYGFDVDSSYTYSFGMHIHLPLPFFLFEKLKNSPFSPGSA